MNEGRRSQLRGDGLPPGMPAEAVKPPGMLRPQYTDYWITGGEVGRWPVWQVGAFVASQVIGIGLVAWIQIGQFGWGNLRPHQDQFWFAWLIAILIVPALLAVSVLRARSLYRRMRDLRHARHVYWTTLAMLFMVVFACWFWISMLLGLGVLPHLVAPMAIVMGVVGFVAQFSVAPRVGATLRCARCGYPFDNAGDYLCSECGKAWLAPSGLVRGEKIRPKPLHYGVIGACVLPVVSTALLLGFSGMHRFTPTDRLIAQAIRSPTQPFGGPWGELQQRTLSTEQVSRIAIGLSGLDAQNAHLPLRAERWLTATMASVGVSDEALERLADSMKEVRLTVPDSARVGEEITIDVTVTQRHPALPLPGLAAFRRVDRFNDESSEHFAQDFAFFRQNTISMSGFGPPNRFTPQSPGEFEVTIEWWYFPTRAIIQPIVWRPDGTPEPPPGAYGVVRRSLTGTVRVLPAEEP